MLARRLESRGGPWRARRVRVRCFDGRRCTSPVVPVGSFAFHSLKRQVQSGSFQSLGPLGSPDPPGSGRAINEPEEAPGFSAHLLPKALASAEIT